MDQNICNYRRPNGEWCKRKVSSGEPRCWQHASGRWHRCKLFMKNPSVMFVLTVIGILVAVFGLYPMFFPPHPERPWVKTTLRLNGPLVIDADGLTIDTGTFYQNTGNTPAIDTVSDSKLYLVKSSHPEAEESQIQKTLCNDLEKKVLANKLITRTVSGFDESPIFKRLHIGRAELDEAIRIWNGRFVPEVLSCVVYRSNFDQTTFHTTSESSVILLVDPSKPDSAGLTFPQQTRKVIPIDQLGIGPNLSLPTKMD
jgi:hypothetical protein